MDAAIKRLIHAQYGIHAFPLEHYNFVSKYINVLIKDGYTLLTTSFAIANICCFMRAICTGLANYYKMSVMWTSI